MKNRLYTKTALLILLATSLLSCKDWLEPEPLSFYAPENTLVEESGFESVLVSCRKQLKLEWFGDANPLMYEYAFSDLGVFGCPEAVNIHNLEIQFTPYSAMPRYWTLAWDGIKYANIIINRQEKAEFTSEQTKNEILAEGYFHRAYWYYRLANQWGNVPLVLEEVEEPKMNFQTESRQNILQQMKQDMEFAVKWLPKDVQYGAISRAAGEHLLTKYYLAVGEFDKAVASATRCIKENGRSLMLNRFGVRKTDGIHDVVNDLFNPDNISLPENTEGILVVQERFGMEGNTDPGKNGSQRMRGWTPYWCGSDVLDPNGKRGCIDGKNVALMDSIGRGIAGVRPSNYYQYSLWDNSQGDMRHNEVNWYDISNLWYNNPKSKFFQQKVQKAYVRDTFRCYFSWPYYKIFVGKDEINVGNNPKGGFTDQYIFRLAETYLLRAEAYYWAKRPAEALADVNEIRKRANAPLLESVTIEDIMDERARELYYEEPRKCELTRVAFIMARLGIDGYSIDNIHKKNYFYDRVIAKNNFYRDEFFYSTNKYVIRPYHILWPIPNKTIEANAGGDIIQNAGYPGGKVIP